MSSQTVPASGRWLQPAEVDQQAPLRIFLFHYAGGGASMWRDWPQVLPADIAVQCIQLPGRQERFGEAAHTDFDALIGAIREELSAELDDRPYAFLGHCMGAQIAYRTAVAIERSGAPGPSLIGVAAWAPDGFYTVPPERADLPEEDLIRWVRGLGSLPADAYADPELLSLVIPAMRADLLACASYVDDGARVSCPIVAYSAKEDPLLARGAMASWASRTPEYLGNCEFPGGHFFIHEETVALAVDFARLFRRCAVAVVG
jgi:surfactin synthase thioesterase subunit